MELKNISVNGTKGKGKGSWTSAQTSVIAKNGGEIATDNFKDIGAIVGSENEKEKLKISAKTIEVKDLKDSNKYENVGGGISLDFEENKPQVPNISVVHDKIDKEQITRATAINTEIKVNNEIVKAEDLGFNTDISNSQETTKDKEKHLNAELHTDLLNEEKRAELKKAAGIISDIGTALTSSKDTKGDFLERYKQASMMRAIGDQVEKNPEYLSILDKKAIKNGKIDDEIQIEQVSVMNKLLNDALARTTRVENISNKKGAILKGVDKYGNKIVYRNFSTVEKSYPTIDVYETINGDEKKVIELKFRE